MEKTIFYRQTETVDWLKTTTKGDIWMLIEGSNYMIPVDVNKRENLGIDITLVEPLVCIVDENGELVTKKNTDFVFQEARRDSLYLYYVLTESKNVKNVELNSAIADFLNEKIDDDELEKFATGADLMSKKSHEKRIKIGIVLA